MPKTIKAKFKFTASILSALPLTVSAISLSDAAIHHNDRQQACADKITKLTEDFYSRAPNGEKPILQNVSLNKEEIPSFLRAFIIPKTCLNSPEGTRKPNPFDMN
jgi:ABC-type sugar transport system ATPase subunit